MKISRPSRLPKVYLTMKQFIVISVVIVYFTVLWMVPLHRRSSSSNPGQITAYKLDRWTGEVWLIRGRGSRLVYESRKR